MNNTNGVVSHGSGGSGGSIGSNSTNCRVIVAKSGGYGGSGRAQTTDFIDNALGTTSYQINPGSFGLFSLGGGQYNPVSSLSYQSVRRNADVVGRRELASHSTTSHYREKYYAMGGGGGGSLGAGGICGFITDCKVLPEATPGFGGGGGGGNGFVLSDAYNGTDNNIRTGYGQSGGSGILIILYEVF